MLKDAALKVKEVLDKRCKDDLNDFFIFIEIALLETHEKVAIIAWL